MHITTIGMTLLLIFLMYYLFLSIKLILIGTGKLINPELQKVEKDKKLIARGIIGALVTFPFFCFIVYIFIQVFLF